MTPYPHVWTFHEPGDGTGARWRHYRCDDSMETPSGLKIASVTQILGVLDSPGLKIWAANETALGAWRLRQEKGYRWPRDVVKDGEVTFPGWRRLLQDMKKRGWGPDAKVEDAQLRGTTVHGMFEDYAKSGKVPSLADQPSGWHGYIKAITAFILAADKAGEEFEAVEMIVGSVVHGYAGKCDTIAVTRGKDGKRKRKDFKTAKQVYARKHFRQLEGYEHAAVEMGEEPTDERAVVILYDDGTFEEHVSIASAQDFLNVVQVWRDDRPLQKHEDAAYKARKEREKAAREARRKDASNA